jgi:hypothetical protein
MVYVTALTGFDHSGRRRKGEIFAASEQTATQLIRAGLVKKTREAQTVNPQKAVSESASASQAAQALPQTIAEAPKRGRKRKQAEESL